ncbi:MAG: helix-turn-helix domain-containing protein [Synergistaceae bacterium]|nr:helix-turn-helix domain-containing protein [Synergistaceae bacterium]
MTERDDALVELGRMITERREALGMTLETVFDRTKIRPEYLRGIEAGDYKNFPEVVYIKGFVRTYLKLINAEDMQDDFMAQLDRKFSLPQPGHKKQPDTRPQKNIASVLSNGSSMPKGFKPASHFWLFLVLVLALAGTGAYVWYAVSYGGLDLRNLKLFSFSGGSGSVVPAEFLSGDMTLQGSEDVAGVPVSSDETVSAEPEPEISPYLEIHAVNDVWLSVSFGGSQPVFRRTMKRGEVMRWDLNAQARVVIGRPTAAQIFLNGKDLGIANPTAKRSETYLYNPDGTYSTVQRRTRN